MTHNAINDGNYYTSKSYHGSLSRGAILAFPIYGDQRREYEASMPAAKSGECKIDDVSDGDQVRELQEQLL